MNMIKKCKYCGKEFEPRKKQQIYCSRSCNQKHWRENNRDYSRLYRQEHREYFREYSRKYYQKHKKEIDERNKRFRDNNKERYAEYQRNYRRRGALKSGYPCSGFHESRLARIPDEMCLNCSAPKCRFDND